MIKIQFGSGKNLLKGWINTNLPKVDIRKKLTYSNNYADFIFHEHVIEHIDEVDGYNFLGECYRILKPNGVMRISCPCVDGFIYCYQNWDRLAKKWPKFKNLFGTKTRFMTSAIAGQAIGFVGKMFDSNGNINSISNGGLGHKYYYDKEDFIEKLTKIGFRNITFHNKGKSNCIELTNIERRVGGDLFGGYPPELELTLEAQK